MKYKPGEPAPPELRAEQLREMQERLEKEELERIVELERVRLSEIESRKRWEETYAAMGLDDIIEIPGKQGGKDIVLRYHEKGGQLIEVKEENLESNADSPFKHDSKDN